MDESEIRELGLLRARAYGPSADIDAPAQRRLTELEARARSAVTPEVTGEEGPAPRAATPAQPVPGSAPPPVPRVPATIAASASASLGSPTGTNPASATSAGTPPASATVPGFTAVLSPPGADSAAMETPPRRPRAWMLGAAAMAVVVLVAGVVALTTALDRPGRVATLAAAPDGQWPDQPPRQEGATLFEEFHGLTAVLIPQVWATGTTVPCLFVSQSSPPGTVISAGCGADEFAPTAALAVAEWMPEELRERYPVGTELQFVLDDDEVLVYSTAG